ncbi:MAG: TauD/TfdA family dioxygenase [Alphaproteobacteria bacterium]
MAIACRPLTPVIGAEIEGVDLGALDDAGFDAVHQALLDHQVLFFRDQDISIDQHKAFGRRFGALHIHPTGLDTAIEDHPEILVIHADDKTSRTAGDAWHSDVSCDDEPPMASILKLHVVPENGGDTLFASMYAAYEALSAPMKRYLEGMTATHDGGPNYRDRARRAGRLDPAREYPAASHPMVRTHPETGRRALFVNSVFTTHVDGVPRDESDAILRFLFAHAAKPQFQCRFRWRLNSVAMWDNRCAQHHAMWDYYPETRSGHRVTVKGDRPV